jgi:hypothetical protein
MSAVIVNDETIAGMLQAAAPQRQGEQVYYYWNGDVHYFTNNLQKIGQLLLEENYRSVDYLYGERSAEMFPREAHTAYRHTELPPLTPIEIVKLCNGYCYQACETPDWPETEAYAIFNALRDRAIDLLPGYEEAAWEYDKHIQEQA